jgi:peroxiredoxin
LRIETLEEKLAAGNTVVPAPTSAPMLPESGLPIGSPAPTFGLPGLVGETLTLESLRSANKPVLLVFSDPSCGPCNALLPELGSWQRDHVTRLTLAVVSRGDPAANRAKRAEHGLTNVLLQRDREIAEAYQVVGTPSAVIVQANGTIGGSVAVGAEAIQALVARIVGQPSTPPTPVVVPTGSQSNPPEGQSIVPRVVGLGQPAPKLRLPDLRGKTVDLRDYRGTSTLVMFWNPGCGFCQRMLPDLKELEMNPPGVAPKLLVVSTGTVEANRALGLRTPVVLDQSGSVMQSFGVNGTPMALLVDARGNVASEVAAGAPAVLALARGEQGEKVAALV